MTVVSYRFKKKSLFFLVQVAREMTNFYDSVYNKAETESLTSEDTKAAAVVLRAFHETVRTPAGASLTCARGDKHGCNDDAAFALKALLAAVSRVRYGRRALRQHLGVSYRRAVSSGEKKKRTRMQSATQPNTEVLGTT